LGKYVEAERYLQEAAATSRQVGDDNGLARALSLLGWVEYSMGNEHLSQARSYYEQSLALLRQTGDRGFMTMCLSDFGLAASEWGDYRLAKELALEGLHMAEEIGHLDMVCYGLEVLGATTCSEGDLAAARDYLVRSLTISAKNGLLIHVVGALYHLARVLVAEGEQFSDAAGRVQKHEMALTYLVAIPREPGSWQFLNDRARALMNQLQPSLPSEVVCRVERHVAQTPLEKLAEEILTDEKQALPNEGDVE
jgi:tetratricopeptide (TPR) repeat protein